MEQQSAFRMPSRYTYSALIKGFRLVKGSGFRVQGLGLLKMRSRCPCSFILGFASEPVSSPLRRGALVEGLGPVSPTAESISTSLRQASLE